jgi:hypothetical protein
VVAGSTAIPHNACGRVGIASQVNKIEAIETFSPRTSLVVRLSRPRPGCHHHIECPKTGDLNPMNPRELLLDSSLVSFQLVRKVMAAVMAIEQGKHSEFGTAILFTQ